MARPQLRIYYGPDDSNAAGEATSAPPSTTDRVTVSLSEVFPLLADAVCSERAWLHDFAEDDVTISSDLYEVLLAYQHYRRPTA